MYHQRVPVAASILLVAVISLAIYIGTRPTVTSPNVFGPTATPNATPAAEMILGGGIRLSCAASCQQELIFPFNEAVLYDTLDDFMTALSGSEKQVIAAWVPAADRLYINQPQLPERGKFESFEEYVLAAQVRFPDQAPASANLSINRSPGETIATVVPFFSGIGFDDGWAELSSAMIENGDQPTTVEDAYFIVGQPGLPGAGYQLHVFDTPDEIEETDPTRACLQNPTWFYRMRYCTYYWW